MGYFITSLILSDFASKLYFSWNRGIFGCNLLLVKELVWMFKLL